MYKIGDLFIYGANGACKIADIKTENFNRNEKIYYILVPVFDIKETIFVPADNEQLVSKMKKILSPAEIQDLIKTIPDKESIWIENVNLRRETYKKIINTANRDALFSLIKTLYERRKELKLLGKNLSVCDENLLRQAQNIIHSEIAAVLEIPLSEVTLYIENQLHAA
ncbi:MAG: CarD family transcriptional regulator [Eubacterium sp.]